MKNVSVYLLISVTSFACAITACDVPEEPKEIDIVVRQVCATPDETGDLLTLELDSSSEWAEDSLTIMTPTDSPFVVRDDGLEGDAIAGDGIFTARSSMETTRTEQQCMDVDVHRPGEFTDRSKKLVCVAEFLDDGEFSSLCGEVCDDWLGIGCVCVTCGVID